MIKACIKNIIQKLYNKVFENTTMHINYYLWFWSFLGICHQLVQQVKSAFEDIQATNFFKMLAQGQL